MTAGGGNSPSEIASLDAFIEKINSLKSGAFLIGRNRIWHGGIHLSEKGGWQPSGKSGTPTFLSKALSGP
jgi:hypothetical protein